MLNFVLAPDGSWRAKNAQKIFFKVLERKNLQNQTISNNILMIMNQNIPAILRKFSNVQSSFMKHFTPRRQILKLLLLNFSAKLQTERKYPMNKLTFRRRKYF